MPILNPPALTIPVNPSIRPTQEYYDAWEYVYDQANIALFDGRLPNCLISMQRNPRSLGFFAPERFIRGDGIKTHELALNPTILRKCDLVSVICVLIHEMLHVDQHHYGTPGKRGYHNREFAEMSKKVGLHTSDTGEPGGKETGYRMSQYINEGGPAQRFALSMIKQGFKIVWQESPPKLQNRTIDGEEGQPEKESKSGKRVRYICPEPHEDERDNLAKAWSREGAELKCGRHDLVMIPG